MTYSSERGAEAAGDRGDDKRKRRPRRRRAKPEAIAARLKGTEGERRRRGCRRQTPSEARPCDGAASDARRVRRSDW